MTAEAIGLLAGFLTTIAFLPQVVRVWRRRSAADISLATFLLFFAGLGFWLVYGLMVDSLPVIAANAATLVLAGAILVAKWRFDR
jgi:MtN3 and saliva related transmembrane protein